MKDRRARGTSRRIPIEQIHAERIQILRNPGGERAGARRVLHEFALQHLHPRPLERTPSGEALVENRADAVPIGRRANVLCGTLLGRHVGDRSDDEIFVEEGAHRSVAHEAEVEDDDAPFLRHEHVGRLDVAVHLARGVQRGETGRELVERRAELVFVEPRFAGRPAVQRHCVLARRGAGRRAARGLRRARHGVDEADAVDELHREEPGALVADQLEESDQVPVLDVLERAELLLQTEERLAVEGAQHLERDADVALAIERLVDEAGSPLTQATHDFEPGELGG